MRGKHYSAAQPYLTSWANEEITAIKLPDDESMVTMLETGSHEDGAMSAQVRRETTSLASSTSFRFSRSDASSL